MKRATAALGLTVLVALGVNAYLDRHRECGCRDECWCQRPVLRHFRWVIPKSHQSRKPQDHDEL